jgi:hypothetical protein
LTRVFGTSTLGDVKTLRFAPGPSLPLRLLAASIVVAGGVACGGSDGTDLGTTTGDGTGIATNTGGTTTGAGASGGGSTTSTAHGGSGAGGAGTGGAAAGGAGTGGAGGGACTTGTVCDGKCVDTKTDPANCGACGKAVKPGAKCENGASCAVHCSGDLHQLVDCNDKVVLTCPDDKACAPDGSCKEPCAGAAENQSTIGCEFYSLPPSPETETAGSCFAALVANTWKTPVGVQVEYKGQPLDVSGLLRVPVGSGAAITYEPAPNNELAPGQIGILFLSQGGAPGEPFFVPCPVGVTPGIQTDPAVFSTSYVDAFHVKTTAPIVAYDIYPYGGASSFVSSATLLVPTPAWGTNYIAADAYPEDPNLAPFGGLPFIQIVASVDGTQVTIDPKAAIDGGNGVQPAAAGQSATYTLAKGQALQLLQGAELAGSPITADHPISVWGGSGCMNIPVGSFACDSGHQQLVPVSALGHEYAAVRYRDRDPGSNESVPWTLIGAADGTTLVYDPAPPAGAPATLGVGQVAQFDASDPFTVKSQDDQHPFYVAGHMTGAAAASGNEGDPDYVNVVPPQQWLPYYLFLTDPTYSNTNLVFVRQKAPDGTFKDVKLDCAGVLGGWQPIGGGGNYEYARVDLRVSGQPQGNCENGVHTAESAMPFGLTVWGWDVTVSYAYPAGMSTQKINQVVVHAIH